VIVAHEYVREFCVFQKSLKMTFISENALDSLNGVNTIFVSVKQLQEAKFLQILKGSDNDV
jgi:hypothetical protein